MFGRNKKRIDALEKQVASLKEEIEIMKPEVAAIKGQVNTLVDEMVIAHLDGESYYELLLERGDLERAETLIRVKNGYEKKLKRFIRATTAKKKLKPKPATDGKETPEAAE